MKIRFLVYSSLLFVALSLPVVYQGIDNHLQEQEKITRKQKENWLCNMVSIDLHFARVSNNSKAFWYHYKKALNYFLLYLEMTQEDLDNALKDLQKLL